MARDKNPALPRSHFGRRRQRGASVLEFAIGVPVFFLIVLSTIEFGRGIFAANEINKLARDAVRYAMVRSATSGAAAGATEVADYVRKSTVGLVADEIEIDTKWEPANIPGAYVEVSLRYRFQPVIGFLPDSLTDLRGSSRGLIAN